MNSNRNDIIIIDDSSPDDYDSWNEVPSRKKRKTLPIANKISHEPFIMLLCGLPGSGKSTFAQMLISRNPTKFERICQDVLGTRKKCERTCRDALKSGKIPIIDRCNFDVKQRQFFLSIAAENNAPVDCIFFQYSER